MVSDSGELAILKMDCEGCEVLPFNHTMQADPAFFDRVDQFALEVHISQRWMPNERAVLAYGRLLALLLRSDFLLFHATTSWCSYGEERGLISQLVSWGYFQRESDHCEVLLFAKARHDDPRLHWRPRFPVVGVHPPEAHSGRGKHQEMGRTLPSLLRRSETTVASRQERDRPGRGPGVHGTSFQQRTV